MALVRLREARYEERLPGDPQGRHVVTVDYTYGVLIDEGYDFSDAVLLIHQNGTFRRCRRGEFDDSRVDDVVSAIGLIPDIGSRVRMPVLCTVSEDRRRKTGRWVAKFSHWLQKDRGLYDMANTNARTLMHETRGDTDDEAARAAADYFQATMPVLGVEWVPVPVYRGTRRQRWVRWTAGHAREALERAGFPRMSY